MKDDLAQQNLGLGILIGFTSVMSESMTAAACGGGGGGGGVLWREEQRG